MDPFENVPNEILCQAVNNITNLTDILSNLSVSRRFQAVVGDCITQINHDQLVYIPIEFMSQFHRLQVTNNIVITLRADQIGLLENLPFLRKAYLQVTDVTDPVNQFIQLLAVLDVYRKTDVQDWKIAFGNSVIFIRNDQYILWTDNDEQYAQVITPLLKRMFIQDNLRYDLVRAFLQNADFGPVDPFESLSDDNPNIKSVIRPLAQNGGIDTVTLFSLLSAYMVWHNLEGFDETMHAYFDPFVEYHNEVTGEEFNTEDVTGDQLYNFVDEILRSHDPPRVDAFPYLSIPEINLSPEEYRNISNKVDEIIQSYRSLEGQPGGAFYF